jgi:molecular chaperone Hsp33
LLGHLEPEVLKEIRPEYRCDCSRERVERALISIGREELDDMIREQHGCEVDCHFCDRRYRFSEEELAALLEYALDRRSE